MPLPASGAISLGDIQTEFNDTGTAPINEFYRSGGLVPSFNTSVPTSGQVSLSNFYSAARASTLSEIWSDLDTPAERNYFMTGFAMNLGKLTSTAVSVGNTNTVAAGRLITSYSASLTFSATPALSQRTENITIVEHGAGTGAAWSGGIVVNSTTYTTRFVNQSAAMLGNLSRFTGWQIPVSGLSLSTVSGTVTSSATNYIQTGQLVILPGTWGYVSSTISSASASAASLLADDIVIIHGVRSTDTPYNYSSFSGSAGRTLIYEESGFWYQAMGHAIVRITSAGNLTVSGNSYQGLPANDGTPAPISYPTYRMTVLRWTGP
jgi:hypothetical protein